MKIRSVEELNLRLTEDLAWRKHEIFVFDQHIAKAKYPSQRPLLRASVALLYSHWEGFVKNAFFYYSCYLASLRLRLGDVKPELIAFSNHGKLSAMEPSKRIASHVEFVRAVIDSNSRIILPTGRDDIRTESNLSSRVLSDLLLSLGFAADRFSSYSDLIDESLVSLRNHIAHGEEDSLRAPEWVELRDTVMSLMTQVEAMIMEGALNKDYLAA